MQAKPEQPTIILATSNGVGMGHLARATAIGLALKNRANPIIISMASAVAEIPEATGIPAEYITGRDRGLMSRYKWDKYLRDRILALVEETGATILTFDGVVPYPGILAAKIAKPDLTLVWIRRGLWQKKPQRFVLGMQSKIMDYVIEPGDYARAYDRGPTSKRKEAKLVAPVSLFRTAVALDKKTAKLKLGLDVNRPAVLVQLGTGDADVNQKMHAALSGLIGWKDLQVVLTKEPKDKNGNSLAPAGLDLKVVRYFPLADLLNAFDAGICAAGYNGVHELLAAGLPTVFVSNIRGTDDQETRARWCADNGAALMADQSNLPDIERTVKKLQDPILRIALSNKCLDLPAPSGANEIAEFLLKISKSTIANRIRKSVQYRSFSVLEILGKKPIDAVKHLIVFFLEKVGLSYRVLFPHKKTTPQITGAPIYSQTIKTEELRALIAAPRRFEHLYPESSEKYIYARRAIANTAYDLNKGNRT
ncbi:MAG: UDP-N-acetylglucosamine--LPS N-acetylglucosamine transferase [Streptomycetaceae bacterium]|nr:MAG: UDP-N-acetylglucosamine--LPS N-acetylglucosamine transferase [Streptomycetaceae bacterium]